MSTVGVILTTGVTLDIDVEQPPVLKGYSCLQKNAIVRTGLLTELKLWNRMMLKPKMRLAFEPAP